MKKTLVLFILFPLLSKSNGADDTVYIKITEPAKEYLSTVFQCSSTNSCLYAIEINEGDRVNQRWVFAGSQQPIPLSATISFKRYLLEPNADFLMQIQNQRGDSVLTMPVNAKATSHFILTTKLDWRGQQELQLAELKDE